MTVSDLKAMKAKQLAFFKSQWIYIMGVGDGEDQHITVEDILKHLFITQYYKNTLDPDSFVEVCEWDEDTIGEKVSMLSAGARDNLIIALNDFIQGGQLDSRKKIKTFEVALGCILLETE